MKPASRFERRHSVPLPRRSSSSTLLAAALVSLGLLAVAGAIIWTNRQPAVPSPAPLPESLEPPRHVEPQPREQVPPKAPTEKVASAENERLPIDEALEEWARRRVERSLEPHARAGASVEDLREVREIYEQQAAEDVRRLRLILTDHVVRAAQAESGSEPRQKRIALELYREVLADAENYASILRNSGEAAVDNMLRSRAVAVGRLRDALEDRPEADDAQPRSPARGTRPR